MTQSQSIETQAFADQLANLCQQMEVWRNSFPKEVDGLFQLRQAFATKVARLNSEGLKLSIGIMGQVKAGKSSFLNALLFGGKPVLPVAATPKTANLTRISYGESPLLTVHFYTPQEWQDIAAQAATNGQHAEAKVARDLLQMVQQQGLNVAQLLAVPEQTIPAADVDGLMDKLNDYVGENGRYTAVVKSTEIQLPLEELKGYDVVDTPGMNDPVPSRTQKTREYMAQCDVVFFLSRASQFLDQSDMDLLARQLPGNGVKRMMLVAGQLDGAISDDGHDRASLAETERNLAMRLGRRAAAEMERLAALRDDESGSTVPAMLRTLKTPILASTFAHGFAAWPASQWSIAMHHVHKELADLARDSWRGQQFTQEDWMRIGNFASLQTAYQQARQDKQALLQAQVDELLPNNRNELHRWLQMLGANAQARATQLRSGDMAQLDAGLRACEASIGVIGQGLDVVISGLKSNATVASRDVKASLTKGASESSRVKQREGTDVVTHYYDEKVFDLREVVNWSLHRTETRSYRSTTSYTYVATADVLEKLVNYAQDSTDLLERQFNRVVRVDDLRASLKEALLNALDTSAEGFDPTEVRGVLQGALDRMALPTLRIARRDVGASISRQFSGEVRDSEEVDALQRAQKDAVNAIQRDLLADFDAAMATLLQQLNTLSQSLKEEFARDLQRERQQLQAAFADKDNEVKVCENIVVFCQKQAEGAH